MNVLNTRFVRKKISKGISFAKICINTRNYTSKTNNVSRILNEMIKSTGPIPVGTYMRQCLTNPSSGYYINRDPFGKVGDFITSPEISQMFGELVAVWTLTQWMAQGSPKKIRLVELGPGRGTLMDDFLRSMTRFKPFNDALKEICMIEASPTLRETQRSKLCDSPIDSTETGFRSTTKKGAQIYWYEDIKFIPNDGIPTFFIAHEFFDALPIYQFQHTSEGWKEYLIDNAGPETQNGITNIKSVSPESAAGLIGSKKPINDDFKVTLSRSWTPNSKLMPQTSKRYSKLPIGSRIEICPELWQIVRTISDSVGNSGGAALIIDYGSADTTPTNTLRGIKQHKWVSPFVNPGEADLSADVDFLAIQEAAKESTDKVSCYGPAEQGDWLHIMGISIRAEMLVKKQTTLEGKNQIVSAYKRLVEKSGGSMGKVYKVLSIVPSSSPTPVGFGGTVE